MGDLTRFALDPTHPSQRPATPDPLMHGPMFMDAPFLPGAVQPRPTYFYPGPGGTEFDFLYTELVTLSGITAGTSGTFAEPSSAPQFQWTTNTGAPLFASASDGLGATVEFAVTKQFTQHSGLIGLHLGRRGFWQPPSGNLPIGLTLDNDGVPQWDTIALDFATDDLILANSHALEADVFRMRRDTAQTAFARVVGQPASGGAQFQLQSGNVENISGITKASSAVVTIAPTGSRQRFLVGETVTFRNVGGMTQINGLSAVISAVTATTITVPINSTGFSTYTSGGQAYSSMTGLSITAAENAFHLLLLQADAAVKRVKVSLNNLFQMGTDSPNNGTADFWISNNATGLFPLLIGAGDQITIGSGAGTGSVKLVGNLGLYGATPVAKPTVSGSRSGGAALVSLLAALVSVGQITDSTSA